jgi:hypothetical protein
LQPFNVDLKHIIVLENFISCLNSIMTPVVHLAVMQNWQFKDLPSRSAWPEVRPNGNALQNFHSQKLAMILSSVSNFIKRLSDPYYLASDGNVFDGIDVVFVVKTCQSNPFQFGYLLDQVGIHCHSYIMMRQSTFYNLFTDDRIFKKKRCCS